MITYFTAMILITTMTSNFMNGQARHESNTWPINVRYLSSDDNKPLVDSTIWLLHANKYVGALLGRGYCDTITILSAKTDTNGLAVFHIPWIRMKGLNPTNFFTLYQSNVLDNFYFYSVHSNFINENDSLTQSANDSISGFINPKFIEHLWGLNWYRILSTNIVSTDMEFILISGQQFPVMKGMNRRKPERITKIVRERVTFANKRVYYFKMNE